MILRSVDFPQPDESEDTDELIFFDREADIPENTELSGGIACFKGFTDVLYVDDCHMGPSYLALFTQEKRFAAIRRKIPSSKAPITPMQIIPVMTRSHAGQLIGVGDQVAHTAHTSRKHFGADQADP